MAAVSVIIGVKRSGEKSRRTKRVGIIQITSLKTAILLRRVLLLCVVYYQDIGDQGYPQLPIPCEPFAVV